MPLEDGDLVVTETPREGWTVASGGGLTVALDLTLTPELERAGLVREVVRLVQEARKNTGLEVSDRIELWWTARRARWPGARPSTPRRSPARCSATGCTRGRRRRAGHRGSGRLAVLVARA